MARPRVFISSTFFDLRQLRTDMERFIREIGYEPVQHELGHVPYGSAEKLETYCYKEIGQVDIVVNIVGGRFGSVSYDEAYSISQMELKTAVALNKQVYVFVDAGVHAEYRMFLRNKDVKGISYVSTDDERIFRFIADIEALPRNNQLIEFRHSDEIAHHLREQWAGLFQRFLQEQESVPDRRAADELHTALSTVNQLIAFLTNEKREQGSVISEILLSNHPIFERLRSITNTPYPIIFRTRQELEAWLNARSWHALKAEHWDDEQHSEYIYTHPKTKKKQLLKIALSVFDQDRLKVLTAGEWKNEWVSVAELPSTTVELVDDDLPF